MAAVTLRTKASDALEMEWWKDRGETKANITAYILSARDVTLLTTRRGTRRSGWVGKDVLIPAEPRQKQERRDKVPFFPCSTQAKFMLQ